MRTALFAGLLLAAGIAAADSSDVVQVRTMEVKERMQVLELINVTAEKAEADDAEPLDAELQAILNEATLLDAETGAED